MTIGEREQFILLITTHVEVLWSFVTYTFLRGTMAAALAVMGRRKWLYLRILSPLAIFARKSELENIQQLQLLEAKRGAGISGGKLGQYKGLE